MVVNYINVTDLSYDNIVLKKNGEIWATIPGCKPQAIGNWALHHPRREEGQNHYRKSELVERFYEGGIPYKGKLSGYSRSEFIECIISLVNREGLSLISSIK